MSSSSADSKRKTAAVFAELWKVPTNKKCVDCGNARPQWASVSHGTFLCIECSGVHRSMGVHISFVRSCTMDAWSPQQLAMMKAGGNKNMTKFFAAQKFPAGISLPDKYGASATVQYRERVKALAKGETPPPIPFIGYTAPIKTKSPAYSGSRKNPSSSGSGNVGVGGFGSSSSASSSAAAAPRSGRMGTQHSVTSDGWGDDDFFADMTNSIISLAGTTAAATKKAAAQVVDQTKAAATVVAAKGTSVAARLQDERLLDEVKDSTYKGWSTVSSWFNSAVNTVSTVVAGDDDDDAPAFGIKRESIVASSKNSNSIAAQHNASSSAAAAAPATATASGWNNDDDDDADVRALEADLAKLDGDLDLYDDEAAAINSNDDEDDDEDDWNSFLNDTTTATTTTSSPSPQQSKKSD